MLVATLAPDSSLLMMTFGTDVIFLSLLSPLPLLSGGSGWPGLPGLWYPGLLLSLSPRLSLWLQRLHLLPILFSRWFSSLVTEYFFRRNFLTFGNFLIWSWPPSLHRVWVFSYIGSSNMLNHWRFPSWPPGFVYLFEFFLFLFWSSHLHFSRRELVVVRRRRGRERGEVEVRRWSSHWLLHLLLNKLTFDCDWTLN